MSFARHVGQRREDRGIDLIPGVVNVITDDHGTGSERERSKRQEKPAVHGVVIPAVDRYSLAEGVAAAQTMRPTMTSSDERQECERKALRPTAAGAEQSVQIGSRLVRHVVLRSHIGARTGPRGPEPQREVQRAAILPTRVSIAASMARAVRSPLWLVITKMPRSCSGMM